MEQPKTVDEHQNFIKFIPGAVELTAKEKQAACARSNKRLETVFGITIGFTTRNKKMADIFLKKFTEKMTRAIHLKGNGEGDWEDIKRLARTSVQQVLTASDNERKLRLVDSSEWSRSKWP